MPTAKTPVVRLAIGERIARPTPEEVRAARKRANLTQTQAAQLISPATSRGAYRTWQAYEVAVGKDGHNDIPLVVWELFLLLTDQHPTLKLVQKRANRQ